jgi:HK97 family phage portal protein
MLTPKGDEQTFITHYEYRPGGSGAVKIDPSDVVHFRFGMDSDDPRRGYSPLKSVLREVFTDDEAANFTASLLRNMGVPGLLIAPKGDRQPSEEDVLAVKSYVSNMFGGDKRGEPLVMSGSTEIAQFGFSPEQLLLKELRRIPEERVSAVLGVPAVVAGLGAGLDRSTFTNMGEAREMAYESNIIPSQRILAEDLRFQLLPDFEADPFAWRVGFDLSKVRVLKDDEDKRVRALNVAYQGGMVTRGEVRRELGLPVDEERDDVYLLPLNTSQVAADGSVIHPAQPAPENGNGGGGADTRALAHEIVRQLEAAQS